MQALSKYRLAAALVTGVVVGFLASMVFDTSIFIALAAGSLTTVGTALVLKREVPFPELRKSRNLPYDLSSMQSELGCVRKHISSLKHLSQAIDDRRLSATLEGLAASADVLVEEIVRDPRGYRRVRKALVKHLKSAIIVAEGVVTLQRGNCGPEVANKARNTFERLSKLLQHHRETVFDHEAFDIDVRITVLEHELSEVLGPARRKPEPKPSE
ncbi:MAG: 5-bromo-4-chloroindolyl phosphate hydrolysis family protein [Hyphomicrobiales bacterium]|nr:5-bromo-4-chloroindolyl phosphate hydrolysis family protein [Hyphomicrobiales bacterium]